MTKEELYRYLLELCNAIELSSHEVPIYNLASEKREKYYKWKNQMVQKATDEIWTTHEGELKAMTSA